MRNHNVQNMMLITLLTAMAILLHSVEPSMPIPVPGVKFGLANAIALITYYMFDAKVMFRLNLIRVFVSCLIRGILFGIGFWMSLSGVILSSLAMIIAFKMSKMSPIGVSVAGALFHNIGQAMMLMVINATWGMIYWLPIMLFSSLPTGLITGYLCLLILKRFKIREDKLRV